MMAREFDGLSGFRIEIRGPKQVDDFLLLQETLARTLDLTWQGMPGQPDGHEIAEECAEALWAAGFRIEERP